MTKNNKPLVSICIPTYNGESYIEDAINSALAQTYLNIEIIISDDNSSDDTLIICERLARVYGNIKVYRNPIKLGLSGNWNESIEKASSNWIKILFQDDLLKPTCVEEMMYEAIDKNVDFVICNREYIFEDKIPFKKIKMYARISKLTSAIFKSNVVYRPEDTAKAISPCIYRNSLGEPPALLFNKKQYHKNDFSTDFYQLIDYIFILNKILTHNFVFIDKDLVQFRIHNNSESMKNSKINKVEKENIYKSLHIRFYEQILICEKLLNDPLYRVVKENVTKKNILIIQKWLILRSYKKYGISNGLDFFKDKKIYSFIVSQKITSFNYLMYFRYKRKHSKLISKFRV
ncbi:MAG: glycosyltransferase family 2 protein [Flavobacteriaceae bacterium]|nr:glycosyltransferase family 2 protein [Flavobacteriaceae bacterium]